MNELKNIMKNTNIYERIITVLAVITLLYIQFTMDGSLISFTTATLGIVYVLLVKYKSRFAMSVGVVQCAVYAILAYINHVNGDVILNSYNVCFLIYGYTQWKRNSTDGEIEVRLLNKKQGIKLLELTVVIYTFMFTLLTKLGGFNPALDALNTTFSCIAMGLCANRFRVQWIYWNIVNISSLVLYTTLFLSGGNVLSVCIMFSLYLINSLHATTIWYKKNN